MRDSICVVIQLLRAMPASGTNKNSHDPMTEFSLARTSYGDAIHVKQVNHLVGLSLVVKVQQDG